VLDKQQHSFSLYLLLQNKKLLGRIFHDANFADDTNPWEKAYGIWYTCMYMQVTLPFSFVVWNVKNFSHLEVTKSSSLLRSQF
jgi:hypothetical protein